MFILTAQKRAVVKPAYGSTDSEWPKDEEGFLSRWPDGRRPDIGTQRAESPGELAKTAERMNKAQIQSGFLDWLFVVDYEAPIHECTPECATWRDGDPDYTPKEAM